jgi:RHS repeat-associated protein
MTYAYDPAGNLIAETDQLGRTTQYAYDARDRRTSVTSPLLNVVSTTYDAASNVKSVTDGLGNTTQYAYDGLNRLVTQTDARSKVMSYAYDPMGNLTAVTDQLNRTTQYGYDALNRRTSTTDPLTHATRTGYDAVGNVTSFTDGLGQVTQYSYDALNRLTKMTDARDGMTAYTYDAVGNLKTLTDPDNNTTSYAYDALDRVKMETNQLGLSRMYGYDAVGNLTSETDRDGRVRRFTYDALDRQTKEEWLDSGNNAIETFNYTFDAASQLMAASDTSSSYAYTYDKDGRLMSVTNAGTPGVPTVVLNYTYDAANNQKTRTDTINGQVAGTNAYSYDVLNRLTSITQSGTGVTPKRVDFSYDDASQMTGITRYSDLAGTQQVAASVYTYDNAGRLTGLTHSHLGTAIAAYTWTYDAADRITQAILPDGTVNYSYDTTDELTGATSSSLPNESYSYDLNGNRLAYQTSADNRLMSDGTYSYTYDNEGNRTSRTNIATGEVTTYTWDYRNRLTQVTTTNASGTVTMQANYTYDVFDRRIGKVVTRGTVAPTTERFVYDGAEIALTFDGNGNQTHRYLYGPVVDMILADEAAGGEVLWPLTDNQGTVRDLLNSAGVVQDHIKYDSFGQITAQTNAAVDFAFAYTGREVDGQTGLYYYRARYYDPGVGQFIAEDPIGLLTDDANLRRFVSNDPPMWVDPAGLAEHTTNKSESNRNKHESANERRAREQQKSSESEEARSAQQEARERTTKEWAKEFADDYLKEGQVPAKYVPEDGRPLQLTNAQRQALEEEFLARRVLPKGRNLRIPNYLKAGDKLFCILGLLQIPLLIRDTTPDPFISGPYNYEEKGRRFVLLKAEPNWPWIDPKYYERDIRPDGTLGELREIDLNKGIRLEQEGRARWGYEQYNWRLREWEFKPGSQREAVPEVENVPGEGI